MAERCLTTIISSGVGVFSQKWANGECDSTGEGSQSCAEMHKIGSTILLSLSCDDLWEFDRMEVVSDASFNYPNISCGDSDIPFTMPNEDVTIKIYLKRKNIIINFIIANEGYGCVGLHFPQDSGCRYSSFSFTLSSIAEDLFLAVASPIHGYRVKDWKIDGTLQNNSTTNLTWHVIKDNYDIEVEFEEEPACNKNQLIIEIEGNGTVSHQSGLYCDYLTLALVPFSYNGYYFYGWEYPQGDPNYIKDRSNLLVNMSGDRSVKAIFLEVKDVPEEKFKLFYCPSHFNRTHVVNFYYNRDFNSFSNPSENINVHFKMTFYSDANKNNKIYTSSSHINNQWYYKGEDGYLSEFPSEGIECGVDKKEIIFDPEILPHGLSKIQKIYGDFLEHSDNEISLVCGVEYYIDIEAYEANQGVEAEYDFVKSDAIIFECKDENRYLWDEDVDKNKWICSSQGQDDLKISDIDNSLNPSISSNVYNNFQIVWQETDGRNSDIYGCSWDAKNDIVYSLSQGFSNFLCIKDSYSPLVVSDVLGGFFVVAYKNNKIKKYFSYTPHGFKEKKNLIEDEEEIRAICYPGLSKKDIEGNAIMMRVYREDRDDSYVLGFDNILPVISKEMIRLDIYGIKGAYAVRLRQSTDNDWGTWIGINSSLDHSIHVEADSSIEAYFLDHDRFIVPFKFDSDNGIKKVCCQILTTYGISGTHCINVFLNKRSNAYYFKFYEDSNYENELPSYNGYFLVSGSKEGKSVYFKAIFNDPVNQNITFNVVQQGINNIYNRQFASVSSDKREFRGTFSVYKEDGVFNKDGKAFIEINFSINSLGYCLKDDSDRYNIIDDSKRETYYKIGDPEDIYNDGLKNVKNKIIDNTSFRQYYDEDDKNFIFGNPNYFREN